MTEHATNIPWETRNKKERYGAITTYELAAKWLAGCQEISDWGGGRGFFQTCLPSTTRYTVVDGTRQIPDQVVADLAHYHEPSEGILLRHVLEMTPDWQAVLENAVAAFTKRLVIVTFTPRVQETYIAEHHLTWPVHYFNHDVDLIPRMRPHLRVFRDLYTSPPPIPERVYYLEKSC